MTDDKEHHIFCDYYLSFNIFIARWLLFSNLFLLLSSPVFFATGKCARAAMRHQPEVLLLQQADEHRCDTLPAKFLEPARHHYLLLLLPMLWYQLKVLEHM